MSVLMKTRSCIRPRGRRRRGEMYLEGVIPRVGDCCRVCKILSITSINR